MNRLILWAAACVAASSPAAAASAARIAPAAPAVHCVGAGAACTPVVGAQIRATRPTVGANPSPAWPPGATRRGASSPAASTSLHVVPTNFSPSRSAKSPPGAAFARTGHGGGLTTEAGGSFFAGSNKPLGSLLGKTSPLPSNATVQRLTETATFTGGGVRISETVVTSGANSVIFGHYNFVDPTLRASGAFAYVNGVWVFSVNSLGAHATFMINQHGVMLTSNGSLFRGCIDCGGTGNVGALDGIGNLSTTSGNNNIGLFNGDFNTGLASGNNNIGVLNGNFNGSASNGNSNVGLLNGNFNGVGYSAASGSGQNNGNRNTGVFNGNFNGDATTFPVTLTQTSL